MAGLSWWEACIASPFSDWDGLYHALLLVFKYTTKDIPRATKHTVWPSWSITMAQGCWGLLRVAYN